MELFQKIEALTGHKMEEYPAEQEAVLLLLERVGEAQRISTMQVSCVCHCLTQLCMYLEQQAKQTEDCTLKPD